MLKARVFVAIVSDKLQVLQQTAVLQHAKYCRPNEKNTQRVLFDCMADTYIPQNIVFELQSAFKFSALDLQNCHS